MMMYHHDGSRIHTAKEAPFGQRGNALERIKISSIFHTGEEALGTPTFLVDNQGKTRVIQGAMQRSSQALVWCLSKAFLLQRKFDGKCPRTYPQASAGFP